MFGYIFQPGMHEFEQNPAGVIDRVVIRQVARPRLRRRTAEAQAVFVVIVTAIRRWCIDWRDRRTSAVVTAAAARRAEQ